MNPFSKVIGVIAALAAIFTAADHTALVNTFGATATGVILSVCTLVTLFSHAINGNGPATPAENTPANQPKAP